MAIEIKMPQLGESVTEGTIGKWLVKPGDRVRKYDPLAEVITDKVNAEIPAPQDGVMAHLVVAAGETVKVGTLIARMDADAPVAVAGQPVPAAAMAQSIDVREGGVMVARTEAMPRAERRGAEALAVNGGELRAAGRFSPAVLRLAQEHGVDLHQLTGTGLGGRISRKDVEAHLAQRGTTAGVPTATTAAPVMAAPLVLPPEADPPERVAGEITAAPAPTAPAALAAAPAPAPADQVIPVTPVRRRIAEKMLQAKHEQPHAWTMVRVDVTGLAKLRDQVQANFKAREGVSLSYLPFVLKAVCAALREYPLLNSTWAGDSIIIRKDLNLSIAVATADALAVPVIRNADRLSLTGLAHAVSDLASRARAGKLTLDDIQGGTFTVNNTGYFGSVLSQPIINYPQAAILSFEQVVREPVVLEHDAIAIRHMVNLCCSLDHRVLDGLVVGRFLQAVKQRLEAYAPGQAI